MKKNIYVMLLFAATMLALHSCKKEKEQEPTPQAPSSQATITDPRDDQVYKTVQIGDQTWFAENLRYSGSIPQVTNNTEWENNTTGAWCYYNNDPSKDAIYGKLYNWFAVNTGTLCPEGWHIATDAEWTILTDYLGGEGIAGGKMKSVIGWDAPNTNATNVSGFSGLSGGTRFFNGQCLLIGSYAGWWSSTEYNNLLIPDAWYRFLSHNNGNVGRDNIAPLTGHFCRCLKN